MKKLLVLFLTIFLGSCNAQECNTLPKVFKNYSESISKIKNVSFSIEDSVNTSSSSWIKNAKYYSCDGNKGFLILETKKQNYIFKDVPNNLWEKFKSASSYGKFYNKNLRGKFKLAI